MKSSLGMANSTVNRQLKYVKCISVAVSAFIHLIIGRSMYFLHVYWIFLSTILVLFLQVYIFFPSDRSKKEYYFIQIIFTIISFIVFKVFTRISKKNFVYSKKLFSATYLLIYNVSPRRFS